MNWVTSKKYGETFIIKAPHFFKIEWNDLVKVKVLNCKFKMISHFEKTSAEILFT